MTLKRRIRNLEEKLRVERIVIELSDGDSFVLSRKDVLPLCTTAFRQRYCELMGEPVPASKYDRELALLRRVAIGPPNQPLLDVITAILSTEEK